MNGIKDFRHELPWYIEFLLLFKPLYFMTDTETGGLDGRHEFTTLGVKYLFGKTYVLSEIHGDVNQDLTSVQAECISE